MLSARAPGWSRRSGVLLSLSVFWGAFLLIADFAKAQPAAEALNLGPRSELQGPITPGQGQRFRVRDARGRAQLGLLHVQVGERLVLIMPDGQLHSVRKRDAQASTDPFVPATRKEIVDEYLARPEFRTWRPVQSRNFLFLYDCPGQFVNDISAVMEAIHSAVYEDFRARGFAVHPPVTPQLVLVFKTQDDLRKYCDADVKLVAYYHEVPNYVALFYESQLTRDAPTYGYQRQISTIAHECVHQTLYNIGVQNRLSRWPMWLSEGLPDYYSPTTRDETTFHWKGLGQVNDARMAYLANTLLRGSAPPDDVVPAMLLKFSVRGSDYAIGWSWVHFLAQSRRDDFWKYVAQVSQRKALENGILRTTGSEAKDDLREFVRFFGTDIGSLQQQWFAHLRRQRYNDLSHLEKAFVYTVEYPRDGRLRREAATSVSSEGYEDWQEEMHSKMSNAEKRAANWRILEFADRLTANIYVRDWKQFDNQLPAQ